ncbi:hypothetical protein BC826DRAFT_1191391 [Russula brevipes]|nr:hypothetical protein BC826DRAFT_1191391 [Russula brevipes]
MPVNEPLPFDVYREQLSSHYLGFALWDPAPDPTINVRVSIGDVGFVRDGAFRRMFNVILKHDDPSNQKIDEPDSYDPLACDPLVNLHRSSLPSRDYPSRQLSTEENTHNPLVAATPKTAEGFTYECQGVGALLSLPTEADREDVLRTKVFEDYIRDNVVSWFAWSQKNGLGVERMEDLILVTGCTLAKSWAVAAFCDPIAKSKISLSVRPHPAKDGRSIFTWSNIHGSVMNNNSRHDTIKPPSNQCVFIKGFRAKRVLFRIRLMRAAAEPLPDDPDNCDEDEIQVTSVPYAPKYRDPLVAVLDYIAEQCPEGTIAIAHDDDLDLIKDVEILTADAVEKFLHDNQVPVLIENGAAIVIGPEEGPPVPDEAKSLWVAISELRRELYDLAFDRCLLLPRNVIPQVSTAFNEVWALLDRAEALNAIPSPSEHHRITLAMYEGLCNPTGIAPLTDNSLGDQLLRARIESHRSPGFFQQFRLASLSGLTWKLYVLHSQIEDTRRELELALDERQLTSLTAVRSATSRVLPVSVAVTAVPTVGVAEPAPPPVFRVL